MHCTNIFMLRYLCKVYIIYVSLVLPQKVIIKKNGHSIITKVLKFAVMGGDGDGFIYFIYSCYT